MKKILLICMVFAAGTIMQAQTIQLPGIGSNQITIANSQINAASQLTFSNPEYNVTSFTVKFATSSNPTYSATSSDNHFTSDMLANIPQMLPGGSIDLQITLLALGEGHQSWQKTYTVQLSN